MKVESAILITLLMALSAQALAIGKSNDRQNENNNLVKTSQHMFDTTFNIFGIGNLLNGTASSGSNVSGSNVSSSNLGGNLGCWSKYAQQTYMIMTVDGAKLRFCLQVTPSDLQLYFNLNNYDAVKTQFSNQLATCASNENTKSCIASSIANLGSTISTSNNQPTGDTNQCVESELDAISAQLNQASDALMVCLSEAYIKNNL